MSRIPTALLAVPIALTLLAFAPASGQASAIYQFEVTDFTIDTPPAFGFEPRAQPGDVMLTLELFDGVPAAFDGGGCDFEIGQVGRIGDGQSAYDLCFDGQIPTAPILAFDLQPQGDGLTGWFDFGTLEETFAMASDGIDGLWTGTYSSDNPARGCIRTDQPCTFAGTWQQVSASASVAASASQVPAPAGLSLLLTGLVSLAAVGRYPRRR